MLRLKKYALFFILLVGCYSCDNSLEVDDLNLLEEVNSEIEDQTKSSFFYCSGNGKCLPEVSGYLTTQMASISWNHSEFYENDHRIFLSCEGANGSIYKEEYLGFKIGAWDFYLPDLDEYTVSYSISCSEPVCGGSSRCYKSGKFRKERGKEGGVSGSSTECFKKYFSYEINKTSDSRRLELKFNTNYIDYYEYMGVDMIRVQEIGSWDPDPGSLGAYLYKKDDRDYMISGLPGRYSFSNNKSYKVMLANSECDNNHDHYLYFTYSFLFDDRISAGPIYVHNGH